MKNSAESLYAVVCIKKQMILMFCIGERKRQSFGGEVILSLGLNFSSIILIALILKELFYYNIM